MGAFGNLPKFRNKVAHCLDISFRDENVANEDLLFDDTDYQKWIEEDDEDIQKQNKAAKIIQHNFEKHSQKHSLQKQTIKKHLQASLQGALTLNRLDNVKDLVVSPIYTGNKKVTNLQYELSLNKNRNEKYSRGLDLALPTPKKRIEFEGIPMTHDVSTSPRKSGRPPTSSYKFINPPRVSVGEMKNPY